VFFALRQALAGQGDSGSAAAVVSKTPCRACAGINLAMFQTTFTEEVRMMNQEHDAHATNVDFSAPLEQLRALLSEQSAGMGVMIAEAEQLGVPMNMQPDMDTIQASVPPQVFEQVQQAVAQVRDLDEELSPPHAASGKLPRKIRNKI